MSRSFKNDKLNAFNPSVVRTTLRNKIIDVGFKRSGVRLLSSMRQVSKLKRSFSNPSRMLKAIVELRGTVYNRGFYLLFLSHVFCSVIPYFQAF
jgi:hypothetical protein